MCVTTVPYVPDSERVTVDGLAIATTASGWRKALFLALARNAADPVEYFRLPYDRTVVMGGHVTI